MIGLVLRRNRIGAVALNTEPITCGVCHADGMTADEGVCHTENTASARTGYGLGDGEGRTPQVLIDHVLLITSY